MTTSAVHVIRLLLSQVFVILDNLLQLSYVKHLFKSELEARTS